MQEIIINSHDNARQYQHGLCYIMAIALHRATGAPLVAIQQPYYDSTLGETAYETAHAGILVRDNFYMDALGIREFKPDGSDFYFDSKPSGPAQLQTNFSSEEDLWGNFTCELEEDLVSKASSFIRATGLDVLYYNQAGITLNNESFQAFVEEILPNEP